MESVKEKIQYLIDVGEGDSMRLEEMLLRVKNNKKLYNSDLNYLKKFLEIEQESPPINMDELQEKPAPKPQKSRVIKFCVIFCSILASLILGILGGVIFWYVTRNYLGKRSRAFLVIGGVVSLMWTALVILAALI